MIETLRDILTMIDVVDFNRGLSAGQGRSMMAEVIF